MDVRQVLLVLAALVGLASCLENDRFVQLQNEHSLMITSGVSSKYALSSELFLAENWKTVSVHGDNLTIVAPNCSKIETTFERLSDAQRTLLDSVLSPFEIGENFEKDPNLVAQFALDDSKTNAYRPMSCEGFGTKAEWYLMTRVSRENFSISGGNLDANYRISRIFVVDGTVTIVYSDGKIEMVPQNCRDNFACTLAREVLRRRKLYIVESGTKHVRDMLNEVIDLEEN